MAKETKPEAELICPSCNTTIRLTESLAAPLVAATEAKFKDLLKKKDDEVAERDAQLVRRELALKKHEAEIDVRVRAEVEAKEAELLAQARKSAELEFKQQLESKERTAADLNALIAEKDRKLTEAQKAQTEALKLKRELEEAKKEVDLNVQKQVNEQLGSVRSQAEKDTEERLSLRLADKEQAIEGMKRTIEELKRKAEQGSQQAQGEVLELRLEDLFRAKFPHDVIDPVAKGEHGADILHRVNDPLGNCCGTIIWESKRTKNWSPSWLPKLREDQREAKANVAVIISQALPDGVDTFELIDEVWVVSPRVMLPFAVVLRRSMVDVGLARQAKEGQGTKMELVYQYLTGPKFKLRVQAIVEAFKTMQDDLVKERRAIQKQWAKRESQLGNAMEATVGMYGDLQGIAGRTLPELEGIEVAQLSDDEETA